MGEEEYHGTAAKTSHSHGLSDQGDRTLHGITTSGSCQQLQSQGRGGEERRAGGGGGSPNIWGRPMTTRLSAPTSAMIPPRTAF